MFVNLPWFQHHVFTLLYKLCTFLLYQTFDSLLDWFVRGTHFCDNKVKKDNASHCNQDHPCHPKQLVFELVELCWFAKVKVTEGYAEDLEPLPQESREVFVFNTRVVKCLHCFLPFNCCPWWVALFISQLQNIQYQRSDPEKNEKEKHERLQVVKHLPHHRYEVCHWSEEAHEEESFDEHEECKEYDDSFSESLLVLRL